MLQSQPAPSLFGEHPGAISRLDNQPNRCMMPPQDDQRKPHPMPMRPLPLREQLQQLRQERLDAQYAPPAVLMIDRMRAALSAFQEETKRDIPIQHIIVFLTVGRNPGKSQVEYARLMPTEGKQSTISRQLTDLSIELRTREPGYGLLEMRTNVRNRRENIYTLSPKGAALYERLIRILEG